MNRHLQILLPLLLAGSMTLGTQALQAQSPAAVCDSLDVDRNSYEAGYQAGYKAGYAAGRQAAATSHRQKESEASRRTQTPTNRRTGLSSGHQSAGSTEFGTNPATIRTNANPFGPDTHSDASGRRFMHRLSAEFRPEYIFPTNPFLEGENRTGQPIDLSLSGHFRYSFQFRPGSTPDRIYGGAYQGLGIAYYDFQRPDELGNPVAVYLFQGARIARLAPRLTFDYEWNFGLSFGWVPYDFDTNPNNKMMGSKVNAYLNVDLLLKWRIMREVDLSAGIALTHFSNGNTKYPNAGLNSIGGRIGLAYNFGRLSPETTPRTIGPAFPRHVSYDLTLFGSWRRRGVEIDGKQYAAPDAYTVVGFNFAPMYNFGYKFRAGVSLDGVYDGSANVISASSSETIHTIDDLKTSDPEFIRQVALGLSARAEFVMPYFNIGIGLGVNVLHKGGDLRSFYQILALKVAVTRNSYLHIGYSLRDFHMPNFLMLGVGYRFNNKYPRHR